MLVCAAEAGERGLVDKLIESGAIVGSGWKDPGGRTLLHAAARGGDEGVLDLFIKAGAKPDVNVLSSAPESLSALWVAVDCHHETVARSLLEAGADVNVKDPERDNQVRSCIVRYESCG